MTGGRCVAAVHDHRRSTFGTNSVPRAIVGVVRRRARRSARGVIDYHSGDHGVLTASVAIRTWRGRIPPTTSARSAHVDHGGARRRPRATPGFSRDRVIGIGVDTTGSTPLPIDAQGASAGARSAIAKATSPRRRGCGRTTPPPTKRRRSPRSRRQHAPQYLAPIGGTYSSEWWWSKIWHCLKVAPEVFDAAASWVELADFVPAVLAGVDDPRDDRPLRLRRRPQGDVLRRVGRPAVEGVPRAARSEARRAARSPLRSRAAAGHSGRQPVPRVGAARSGFAKASSIAMGGFDAHYGAVGSGHRGRHAGEDHRHVDVRLRDRAGRPKPSPTSPASAASSTARSCPAFSASRRGSRRSATSSTGGSKSSARAATALHDELSREARVDQAGRVGAARARLEQRQPHDPGRSAADRAARSGRRCTRRARRSIAR